MTRHPDQRSRRARVGDRGYAVIMTALLMIPLMGFAGFAVDVGGWYAQASSIQRAADAAALAGVVWQPDFARAEATARVAASRNGYTHGVDGIEVRVTDAGTQQIEVEIIDTEVDLYFSGVFLDAVEVGRSSTAEYVRAVPMGSPENFLGNDPVQGEAPNLWLATFGPNTSKRSGDRYHTTVCGGAIFCTGNTNDEYAPEGYFFTIDVSAVQAAPLNVEVFDAVHHQYQDRCDGNHRYLFPDGDVASQSWYATNEDGLANYPEERYERGGSGNPGGAAWCPGDNGLSGAYEMQVIVRSPDDTPFDLDDNPVACWTRWGSDVPANQADFAFDLTDESGRQPLGSFSGTGIAPAPTVYKFREFFREWVNVCSITTPQVGEYIVQVRTNGQTSNPTITDPAASTGGRNRYSIRTGFGSATNASFGTGVSISAEGRLPMFVNVPPGAASTCAGSPTCFYIARVTPAYAGQQLQLDVFDLTDGSAIDVTFVPPADSGLGSFTSCDFVFFNENGSTADLNETGCTALQSNNSQLRNGGSNGDSIAAIIDIPVGYTCDEANPFGCWVTAQMVFYGNPSDTTTWSAVLTGDPIRLTD
ncbi:MAG: pilus assembly protein TadG-related protein [Actinomycetota bacterium]